MYALAQPLEEQPYTPVLFDISGKVASLTGTLTIAGWVFLPPTVPAIPRVLVCFPGASYTKRYYHLAVPGFAPAAYSFALALARSGCIVVCLDHLGVGDSSAPDGTLLTLATMAQANAVVAGLIQEHIKAGTLITDLPALPQAVSIGVGHSMGAFVVLEQQATHRSFAAIALLGYTNGPLVTPAGAHPLELLCPHLSRRDYLTVDREVVHPFFYVGVPRRVIEADDRVASAVPAGMLLDMQQPNFMLPKAAQIAVPVFLANADSDLSADFHGEPATYPAARDISLFQLPESGHCHNFAPTRHLLWQRLARWCQEQDVQRRSA